MVTQAKFSFEGRTRELLRDWGMDQTTFASLVGLFGITGASRSKIADALRGNSNLPNETTERLEPVVAELAEFVQALAPVRPKLNSAAEIYLWLEARRKGRLIIQVSQS